MAEEENCSKDLGEVSKELKFLAFLLEASSMYRLSLIFSLISEFFFLLCFQDLTSHIPG